MDSARLGWQGGALTKQPMTDAGQQAQQHPLPSSRALVQVYWWLCLLPLVMGVWPLARSQI
jgi:hypothetical protein